VTVCEPRWTDEDRAWVLALLAEQAEVCKGCGNSLAECMDPRTQYTWQVKQHICEACRVLEAAQENAQDGTHLRGLKFTVTRRGGRDG